MGPESTYIWVGLGDYHSMSVEVRRIAYRNFLSFHHVDSRDQVQVIRLGVKYLYPMSHLVYPDSGKFAVG